MKSSHPKVVLHNLMTTLLLFNLIDQLFDEKPCDAIKLILPIAALCHWVGKNQMFNCILRYIVHNIRFRIPDHNYLQIYNLTTCTIIDNYFLV